MYIDIIPLLTEADRYLKLKDYDRAAECYVRARELCKDFDPRPLLGLARIAMFLERYDDGRKLLDVVLEKHPRSPEALTYRGVAVEEENMAEAMAFHHRALAIDPTHETAHFNLGRCYGLQGRYDLAAASFKLAIQHGARGPDIQTLLGTTLFRAKRTSEAIKVLTITVNHYPNVLDPLLALADVLVETGSLGLANQLLERATQRLPEVAVIASRRAAISLRMKDLEVARAEAWRTTTLAPLDEEAWMFAAVIDTMRLDFDSAEKALRQVIKLNPKHWRAHYHLGGLADALRNRTRAIKHYRDATELNPHAWEPINNLAVNLLEEGSPASVKEARHLLERAIRLKLTPDAVMTHYNLAITALKLGDLPAAQRSARELLRITPVEHPMAIEARRILKVAA